MRGGRLLFFSRVFFSASGLGGMDLRLRTFDRNEREGKGAQGLGMRLAGRRALYKHLLLLFLSSSQIACSLALSLIPFCLPSRRGPKTAS